MRNDHQAGLTLEYIANMSESIGQQLKQIRELQGITLEDIAYKIHVRYEYLEAIEAGEAQSLLTPTQIRGFLRLYANEIGVDLEELKVKGYHLYIEDESWKNNSTPDELLTVPDDSISTPTEPSLVQELDGEQHPDSFSSSESDGEYSGVISPPFDEIEQHSSAAIFREIGQTLKSRRELISLTLDDIHQQIHVKKPFLRAIEAGDFSQLPSTVQAKGMLQNYSDFLNLDTESILLTFSEGLQLQRNEKFQVQSQQKQTAKELSPVALKLKNFFTLDLLVILTLFFIFAGFVIWGINRILTVDGSTTDFEDIPDMSEVLLGPGTPTMDLFADTDEQAMVEDNDEIEEDQPEPQQDEQPIILPGETAGPVNIIIVPRQRTWVRITVDGEINFEGRLLAGNAYEYSGQEAIEVRTGNAGALQIFFNDEDIGTSGLLNQVIQLTFTETGLILPTPTITPTITETPEMTPTPTETPTPSPTPPDDD